MMLRSLGGWKDERQEEGLRQWQNLGNADLGWVGLV